MIRVLLGSTLALLLLGVTARAGDPPRTTDQVVQAVLDAHAAEDADTLAKIAALRTPDPWQVADALCASGAYDAAEALAQGGSLKDTETLPAYIHARRKLPTPKPLRQALTHLNAALGKRDLASARAALEGRDLDGTTVVAVRLAFGRGLLLRAEGRPIKSVSALEAAAAQAKALGWWTGAAASLHEAGVSAYGVSKFAQAVELWKRRAAIEEARGHDLALAATLGNIGLLCLHLGRYDEALDLQKRALPLYKEMGSVSGMAGAWKNMGDVHAARGDKSLALECFERALEMSERTGDQFDIAMTLVSLGRMHAALRAFEEAIACEKRAQKILEELGHRSGVATAVSNLGSIYKTMGRYAEAKEALSTALRVHREMRDKNKTAITLVDLGAVHESLGDHEAAIACQTEALGILEDIGNRPGAAVAAANLGTTYRYLGAYPKARDYIQRALQANQELGRKGGVACQLDALSLVLMAMGEYEEALQLQQRCLDLRETLGDSPGMAGSLVNMGTVLHRLGRQARAFVCFGTALELYESVADRYGIAATLANLGWHQRAVGQYERAYKTLGRARSLFEDLGRRSDVAACCSNLAAVLQNQGHFEEARDRRLEAVGIYEALGERVRLASALSDLASGEYLLGNRAKALADQERALALLEKLGFEHLMASGLQNAGLMLTGVGRLEEARVCLERSLALAEEYGRIGTRVSALQGLAANDLAAGDAAGATARARLALEAVTDLLGRLPEGQSSSVREHWDELFDLAARAAVATNSPTNVFFALEHARAGALLEALQGRDTLRATVVPPGLREAEEEARAGERVARHRMEQARKSGDLQELRSRKKEFQAAQSRVGDAVERIQVEARASSDLLYPDPADLEAVQQALAPEEAMVLYALLQGETVALVVTADDARIQRLGATAEIERLAAELDCRDPEEDVTGPVKRLRQVLVEPLALSGDVRRILLSPHKRLAYLPFALLVGARDIVYVPSGSTWLHLKGTSSQRTDEGEILALGDPDYGGRRGLSPLPATRAEVQAIGDVVLVGGAASESGFRGALQEREHWRSVHLACHGLLDTQRPLLSSLALTQSDEDDGLLTVLEVFGLDTSADLVVLAACETARGRVFSAEGILGLPRAFMYAGAPRVICSLWKVDDDATGVMMKKFYELWNPRRQPGNLSERSEAPTERGEGSKGPETDGTPIPAATALRLAQEYVRNQEKWRHPYYWAAWTLWGL